MNSPFKFLDPYELEDRDAFFGRDAETRALYSLVSKNRLTFVYGPSGTGKTSLVQCGLAALFGGVDWLPLFVRKGEDINDSLRRELSKAAGKNVDLKEKITDSLQQLYKHYLRPVYLIFDQFEELFILGDPDENKERMPFYETIADILEAELPCRLLFIMREDYFGHLNQFEKLVPDLYHRKLRVEAMSRDNLHQVVVGSCNAYGIPFGDERRDPDRMLDNLFTRRTAVQMPFVQVYLHLLFGEAKRQQVPENGRPVRFDQPAIKGLGPIDDALGLFLKEQEAAIFKELMDQGLNPGEDFVRNILDVFVSEEGTKIPMPYKKSAGGDILLGGKTARQLAGISPGLLNAGLEALEKSRILRRGETGLEIAHDTLAFHIFQQRSDEKRQLLEIRRRLETGYREYVDSGGTYYLSSGQLARIEPFIENMGAMLEPEWQDFLVKSRADAAEKEDAERARVERELQLAEEKLAAEQRAREQERRLAEERQAARDKELQLAEEKLAAEKRSRRRQRWLTVIIALVAVGALVASIYAQGQKQEADRRRNEAQTSLCQAWQDQYRRVQLEARLAERNAATFLKADETKNAARAQQELDSLNNLMTVLAGNIAQCEGR
ncbi:MAG TPA: hypothetical protein PKE06_03840 [Flavilitoribacter sp.]|nr:hypothetical protein [Flavilitoribacter sp.]